MIKVDSTDDFISLLSQNKILIYGAGYTGHYFLDRLKEKALEKNVVGFVTTNGDEDYIDGIKVYSVDEIYNDNDEIICVAVHESIKKEIFGILEKKSLSNYIWVTPFIYQMELGYATINSKKEPLSLIWSAEKSRIGVPVKCLAIEQYYGMNDCGYDIYKHQVDLFSEKHATSVSRLNRFIHLIGNVNKQGFDDSKPVYITTKGDIIDGAHRTSIAIWNKYKEINCDVYDTKIDYRQIRDEKTNPDLDKASELGFTDDEITEIKRMRDMIDRQMEELKEHDAPIKSMAELQSEGVHFYVDLYQRGYRWTESQVRDLLDDIKDFVPYARKNDAAFYCLQPVIVSRKGIDNTWTLIDGQQRMTTLYLIFCYFKATEGVFAKDTKLPFEISYSQKPRLEECLKVFSDGDKQYYLSDDVRKDMAAYEDNIDCYHVVRAYEFICDYFYKLRQNSNAEIYVNGIKETLQTRTKIIWYEVNAGMDNEVSVFSKINRGRIPLTNAELIKALLLENKNDNPEERREKTNISIKWEEIEHQLSDDMFFRFLVNEKSDQKKYTTRIDFIFDVMAKSINESKLKVADQKYEDDETYSINELSNNDKFSFYVFSSYFRCLKLHPDNDDIKPVKIIWDMVLEYYRMFTDWYNNTRWYHMVGCLVIFYKERYKNLLLELIDYYRNNSKTDFENHLRLLITNYMFRKTSLQDMTENIELDSNENANRIRNLLLLYNIAYLDWCGEGGRFPFDKFKEGHWDIEHINAIADTMPDDTKDSENNVRLEWLRRAKEIPGIDDIEINGRKIQDCIDEAISEKKYLSDNRSDHTGFAEIYNKIIESFDEADEVDNSIGNLTLLDSTTNRTYKNDVFPLKRKMIIQRTLSDAYIPICTQKVFLKSFIESEQLVKWAEVDKEGYRNDIVRCITHYLKGEDYGE